MGKKKDEAEESTIENRVYLFKDLAAAWLQAHGGLLGSSNAEERVRAVRALADLAHASCVMADSAALSPEDVSARIRDTTGD